MRRTASCLPDLVSAGSDLVPRARSQSVKDGSNGGAGGRATALVICAGGLHGRGHDVGARCVVQHGEKKTKRWKRLQTNKRKLLFLRTSLHVDHRFPLYMIYCCYLLSSLQPIKI